MHLYTRSIIALCLTGNLFAGPTCSKPAALTNRREPSKHTIHVEGATFTITDEQLGKVVDNLSTLLVMNPGEKSKDFRSRLTIELAKLNGVPQTEDALLFKYLIACALAQRPDASLRKRAKAGRKFILTWHGALNRERWSIYQLRFSPIHRRDSSPLNLSTL